GAGAASSGSRIWTAADRAAGATRAGTSGSAMERIAAGTRRPSNPSTFSRARRWGGRALFAGRGRRDKARWERHANMGKLLGRQAFIGRHKPAGLGDAAGGEASPRSPFAFPYGGAVECDRRRNNSQGGRQAGHRPAAILPFPAETVFA